MQLRIVVLALCGSMGLAGCAERTPVEDSALSEPGPGQPAQAPTAVQASSTAEVSVADIERWSRGMAAELDAVREAAADLAAASDDDAKLEALTAASEMSTVDAGAVAAGVDRDRYRRIRNVLSDAVSHMSPIEVEIDVANMPAEIVSQMQQARVARVDQLEVELPADVFAALQTQAKMLRVQEKGLVAERLKVASSAR